MRPGDPQECRERAAFCAKCAATSSSPFAREKYAHMAEVWLRLALRLEKQWPILDAGHAGPIDVLMTDAGEAT